MHQARRTGEAGAASIEAYFAAETDDPLAGAFAGKRAVHPFLGMRPVPDGDRPATWAAMRSGRRDGKSVAYIHVPFCENHCLFCGFYQNPWRASDGPAYADAVVADLARDRDAPCQASGPVHAVYFGGGTPSALAGRDLARMIEAATRYLPLAGDYEITVEGRVHGFDDEKVAACLDAGANRFSIGVQSFDERLRRRLGRKAGRREIVSFLERLVAGDRAAIVIDLIYGLPEQSLDDLEADIRMAAATGIDGLDLYSLNLIPGTPLIPALERGKFSRPVEPGRLGSYFERGSQVLAAHRWEGISTSHWRRTTRERNLYNLLVKTGASCLAFGSGAGGFLDGRSYRVDRDLGRYLATVGAGEAPVTHIMAQAPHHALLNAIKGGMESGRLDIAQATAALAGIGGATIAAAIQPLLEQWCRAGLLRLSDGWLELTLAGRFWQVSMTQRLIEWINHNIEAGIPSARTLSTAEPTGETV